MKLLVLALALISLSACDKIHNLMDVPNKMDDMNKKMDSLTAGMNDTNTNMGQMIVLMGKTVDGVDKQKVIIPFEQLMNEDNYDLLYPVPSKLMPYAKEFAAAIPVADLAELSYLWSKEIREVNPAKKMDAEGNEIEFTSDEVARINNVKMGRFYALMSVAGFLSDEKVAQFIETHIYNYSRYEESAYEFLMMRTKFINDILLTESLLAQKITTVGKFSEAMTYAGKLDFIARLPFKASIGFKISGFLPPMDSAIQESLNPKMMVNLLKKIDTSVKSDFKLAQLDAPINADPQKNAEIIAKKKASYDAALGQLNSQLEYWNTHTAQ